MSVKHQKHMVHAATRYEVVNNKCTRVVELRNVVVLAIVGTHAMVRRPGCIPYVCATKELLERIP